MSLIARIIGLSVLTAGLAAGFGFALLGDSSDRGGVSFVLGCVGGIIGAIAGAAREIASARREGHSGQARPATSSVRALGQRADDGSGVRG